MTAASTTASWTGTDPGCSSHTSSTSWWPSSWCRGGCNVTLSHCHKSMLMLYVVRSVMVVSYVSIICQLHRINIERRSLTVNTALPLTYKSSRLEKCEALGSSSAQPGQTPAQSTETSEFTTISREAETEIVEEFVQGTSKKSWPVLSYRSHSMMVKKNTDRQRRLSDFIGLAKVGEPGHPVLSLQLSKEGKSLNNIPTTYYLDTYLHI